MIVDVLDQRSFGPWLIQLEEANYRPGRRFVSVERLSEDPREYLRRDVGYSDDTELAGELFETTCRVVSLLVAGECDAVGFLEIEPGADVA